MEGESDHAVCGRGYIESSSACSAGCAVFSRSMNHKTLWLLLQRTFDAWSKNEAPRLGAALAFYSTLSLAPLIMIVVGIVGLFLGHTAAEAELLAQVAGTIGPQGRDVVLGLLRAQRPASGALASLIGILTLLFAASGVFGELRAALNMMWNVRPESQGGLWEMIRQRFFSFGMVLAVGFLLLISLVISAVLAAVGKFFAEILPLPELILEGIHFVVSLAGTAGLFALIFRYVPARRIAWNPLWIGATATALLFTLGEFAIGLYLGKAAIGSAYGAAGSLVVVTVWVYYSAMIFLFGAQFTHTLDMARGERTKSARA